MSKSKKIKEVLTKDKHLKKISYKDFVSTGSTLLNLCCTGKVNRGFMKGLFYYLVGDSKSGKTFLSLTCLAEAANNKFFDDYRFIFDNVEKGALMDLSKFFGQKAASRIEPPAWDEDENPIFSSTIEEFYFHVDDATREKKPFIYIIDSMDSLSSDTEADKFQQQKEAHRKGTPTTGSYGDGKAKKNSSGIRQIINRIEKKGSIVIAIGQTRDNMGFGYKKRTRAGGHAPTFYAALEIWSKVVQAITRTVKGKKRKIGSFVELEVQKNRVNGKERIVQIPIYNASGFDDVGGCVEWLIEEGHWKGKKKEQKIKAPEFKFEGSKEHLIKYIEEHGLEKKLKRIVQLVWDDIEEACDPGRKKRYE